ncbi:MAG: ABC transporter substrate-binding protein [Acidobacteria bacterium]|jgi:peptide/nickel transport system substrate-binding protein|nr:ABC transporter substrate-binding protein [Acidobacteriota bacterium]
MILRSFIFLVFAFGLIFSSACRNRSGTGDSVTVALPEKFTSLDTLTSKASDAAAERVRNLMFNSLVKKDEKFDYVGDLAEQINTSEDGKIITFVLRDNVKFHNGKTLTSADVKYTFDEMFKSGSNKSNSFFETVEGARVPHITSIDTPDAKTVSFTISRPSLKNQLLPNLVPIPIIAEGTISQQAAQPVGTGAFKFAGFDQSQNIVELTANPDYWEGAPKVQKIRVKTVTDAGSLQAELQSGGVDLAPLPNNLPPDTLKSLGQNPKLEVKQFEGSNIDYLGLNTQAPPLDNVKIRQAIAYAVNREQIINELLSGQAVIANSILPVSSWAYNDNVVKYSYNPERAKQLVREAGYKNEPIKFKFSVGNTAVNQYAQVIQRSLQDVGLNVEIETLEPNTLRSQLTSGQFQMNTGRWIGGNQDPIFLRDLFATSKIPTAAGGGFNRSRYSNPEYDKIIEEAFNLTDRDRAKALYFKAQEIAANDVPMIPLWYPANMSVSNRRVGNIKIGASGDFSFIKDITIEGQ